ncbi:MAG: hypothetical protein JWM98_781, partial [Thermoleophilia bacterium]|nr:hypothetical protein [Thermoleophilia bacterium]
SHAGHKDAELMRAFVAAARATSLDVVPDFLTQDDRDAEHAP